MMEIVHVTADRRDDWNTLVAREPSFSLLQAWEWGTFKEEAGWKAYRVAVQDQGSLIAGAQMLIKSAPLGVASMAYVPRGPVGDWLNEAVMPLLLDELHRIARGHRAVFLRIEPSLLDDSPCASKLQSYGFKSSLYTNQPRATIVVDLSQGMEALMMQLHQKTRYNIRYAAKQGVTVRVGTQEDLPMFHRLMEITGQRGEFAVRSLDYYQQEWQTFSATDQMKLFIASYQNKPIAVNMTAVFGGCGAYLHGGSSGQHGNLQPNYLIMWEAMQWAYAQGCYTFDLWGIPDELGISVYQKGEELPVNERTDGLWGVYRFKRGFSRNIWLFASAHDYAYSPFLYAMATNKYFSTGTLERIATVVDSFRHPHGDENK